MKTWLNGFAAWAAAAFQTPGREFDPDLLLQPGGSVLAIVLWLYTKATMGGRSDPGLGAKRTKLPAKLMSAAAGDALATNLPSRLDNTGLKVIANWTSRGKLRTCARDGGTRS
jgi:hypothetical protein